MGKTIEVTKEQLIEIIKGIEARGEDASELRRQLESLSAPTKPMARVTRVPLRAGFQPAKSIQEQELLNIPNIDVNDSSNPFWYTMKELKQKCIERGLSNRGNKIDLVRRLFL